MSNELPDAVGRGRHPVGVRTVTVVDESRDGRALPVEVWYPASERHRGQDLDRATMDVVEIPVAGAPRTKQRAVRNAEPESGARLPLVVFSHGHAGFRCASTFLTTHLASHGFVVVAPDHVGDTMLEVISTPRERQMANTLQAAVDRPRDLSLVIDSALDSSTPLGARVSTWIDPARIAVSGHSFGGFTAVVSAGLEGRARACLPLAPPGIVDRDGDPLGIGDPYRVLPIGTRPVPTLVIAADRDALCPLGGVERLVQRLPAPAALAVLSPADHFHFADAARAAHQLFAALLSSGATGHRPIVLAPFDELIDESSAHAIIRGLATAFLRRALGDDASSSLDGSLGAEVAGIVDRFAPHLRLARRA